MILPPVISNLRQQEQRTESFSFQTSAIGAQQRELHAHSEVARPYPSHYTSADVSQAVGDFTESRPTPDIVERKREHTPQLITSGVQAQVIVFL